MAKLIVELPEHLHERLRRYVGRLQAQSPHRVTITQVVGNIIEKLVAASDAPSAGALSNVGTDAAADAPSSAEAESPAAEPAQPPQPLRGATFDV